MRIGHARRNQFLGCMFMLGTAVLIAATLAPRSAAETTYREQVLYSFCAEGGCTDGRFPAAGLIMDVSGHLYGTTTGGGADNGGRALDYGGTVSRGSRGGTVFELLPPAEGKTAWTERVLYSFCAQANCTDGFTPEAAA